MNAKIRAAACVAMLACPPAGLAQDSRADRLQTALGRCGDAPGTFTTLHDGYFKDGLRSEAAVVAWSGRCIEGRREGAGTLTYQLLETEEGYYGKIEEPVVTTTFVNGRKAGLECLQSTNLFQQLSMGRRKELKPFATWKLGGICQLRAGFRESDAYTRMPTGDWQLLHRPGRGGSMVRFRDTLFEPLLQLPAGSLERQSDRIIVAMRADAAAEGTIQLETVKARSPAFAGLANGGELDYALPLELTDSLKSHLWQKRVAFVYSERMLRELERFASERDALLAASVTLQGPAADRREEFARASDPARLAKLLVDEVRTAAYPSRFVVAADLTVLARGEADVVLLLDWFYRAKLDQFGKFREFVPATNTNFTATTPHLVYQSLSAYAIGPDGRLLSARRIYEDFLPRETSLHGCVDVKDRNCRYFELLAESFRVQWGAGLHGMVSILTL